MSLSQCDRIIQALKSSPNGITSTYMIQDMRIYKYSSRLADLRKRGYTIRADRVKGSLYRYILVAEPGKLATPITEEVRHEIQTTLGIETPKKEFRMV